MSQENCPYFNELALETYYDMRANEGNYTKVDLEGFSAYINSDNNEVIVIKKWR